jgi:hypothetical protein
MIDALCAVIRATGVSDSAAAAQVSLHPSTVSRWKKENTDFAILLRSAREEFRDAQLAVIMEKAHSGEATSWRAAAWLLERTFPEDYAPRAKERALFQERFEAICAAEEEGGAIALVTKGESLQKCEKFPCAPRATGGPGQRGEPGGGSGNRPHAAARRRGRAGGDRLPSPREPVAKCEKFPAGRAAPSGDALREGSPRLMRRPDASSAKPLEIPRTLAYGFPPNKTVARGLLRTPLLLWFALRSCSPSCSPPPFGRRSRK